MKFLSFLLIFVFYFNSSISKEIDDIFFVGKMESYNQKFTLYFKTREKAIVARGKNFNYITDYPQDLYIYNYFTKEEVPLISYDWFPKKAKTNEYFPHVLIHLKQKQYQKIINTLFFQKTLHIIY